jgi:predicted nucleic acid-binding protein
VFVIDASVVVKWYLLEDRSEQADLVYNTNLQFFAPPLLQIEVLSAIVKSCRINRIDKQASRVLCSKWLNNLKQGIVRLSEQVQDTEYAIDIALKHQHQHQYQDCCYIALAKRLHIALITDDKKQYAIALADGITAYLLADYFD